MAINVFEGARRITKLCAAIWMTGWIAAAFFVSPTINVTYKLVGVEDRLAMRTDECPSDSDVQYHDIVTKSGTKASIKLCRVTVTREELIEFAKEAGQVGDHDAAGKATAIIEELDFMKRAQLEAALVKADAAGNADDARIIASEIRRTRGKTSPINTGHRADSVMPTFEVKSPDGQKFIVKGPEGATKEQALSYAQGQWPKYAGDINRGFAIPKIDEAWIDRQWWSQLLNEMGEGALVAIGGLLFLWTFTWGTGWVARGFMGIPQGQDQREKRDNTTVS